MKKPIDLPAHYEHIQVSIKKIREISIKAKTEEELFLQTPAKYRNLQLTHMIWKEKTQTPPDYSVTPLEKIQIKFKHYGIHLTPKLYPHLPPAI